MAYAFTPEQVARVRELAGQGLDDKQIGAEVGMPKQRVTSLRRRHDILPGSSATTRPPVTVPAVAPSGAAAGLSVVQRRELVGAAKRAALPRLVDCHVCGAPELRLRAGRVAVHNEWRVRRSPAGAVFYETWLRCEGSGQVFPELTTGVTT